MHRREPEAYSALGLFLRLSACTTPAHLGSCKTLACYMRIYVRVYGLGENMFCLSVQAFMLMSFCHVLRQLLQLVTNVITPVLCEYRYISLGVLDTLADILIIYLLFTM